MSQTSHDSLWAGQDQGNKASATASPFASSRCCSLKDGILKMEDKKQKGWFPVFAGGHFYDKHSSATSIRGQKIVIFRLKKMCLCVLSGIETAQFMRERH